MTIIPLAADLPAAYLTRNHVIAAGWRRNGRSAEVAIRVERGGLPRPTVEAEAVFETVPVEYLPA